MVRNPFHALRQEVNRFVYRVNYSPMLRKISILQFQKFYYNSKVWQNTNWLGVPLWKCPLDLWIYQEIIFEIRPNVIIECGTAHGGNALYLASLLDLVNNGEIITIDITEYEGRPKHKRIKYLLGSSTSKEIVEQIRKMLNEKDKILVILDSDHHKNHVINELKIYSDLVTEGSYIIVEDTNINGHPVYRDFGPGPMEAVEEFLLENKNFIQDATKEKFYVTFNPKGYLKKTR
jgi:cephalosporin hydroxylase